MAGATHEVSLGDDETLQPWPLVIEIAEATKPDEWVLVGGLMVRLHEYRAGLTPARATHDVDMVVNASTRAASVGDLGMRLRGLGFEPDIPDSPSKPVYRFRRGKEQIDLMVQDHLPPRPPARLVQRPAFPVDGGTQAVTRRDTFGITTSTTRVEVSAPDALGALIIKGAAHMVDNRDADRHLEDAAVLYASIETVGGLALDGLNKNDRRRLRHLDSELQADADAWEVLDGPARRRGQTNREFMSRAAGL